LPYPNIPRRKKSSSVALLELGNISPEFAATPMASGHLERMRKRPVPPVGRAGRQMSVDSAMRHVTDDAAAVRRAERASVAHRANEWWRAMQDMARGRSSAMSSTPSAAKEEHV
jgi:hypothetical protein